jgi:hypothetical protein
MSSIRPRRRTGRRYAILVVLVLAATAGWTGLWYFAAAKARAAIEGWRAREAEAGRTYQCGSQNMGGFPFRIEVTCAPAAALLRGGSLPLEIKTGRILVAAQIYQPDLLISEIAGPLTIADPGQAPRIIADWKLAQTSVRGTPAAPERVSLVFDDPVLDAVTDGSRETLLRAEHIEIHGRIAEGSVTDNPVIEIGLRLRQASAPPVHAAVLKPLDAVVDAFIRGLSDFSPKPWPVRFREIQAAGGRIDIANMRVQQGDTIAIGKGSLSLNADGYLQGRVQVTVAGLEPFLKAIGAENRVRTSHNMDKLAGVLNRVMPGLGDAAREQASTHLSAGIAMLGEPATLEGRQAVSLPLRFDNGAVFLGPIPVGHTRALF